LIVAFFATFLCVACSYVILPSWCGFS